MRCPKPLSSYPAALVLAMTIASTTIGLDDTKNATAGPSEENAQKQTVPASAWISIDGHPKLLHATARLLSMSGLDGIASEAGYGFQFQSNRSVAEDRLIIQIIIHPRREVFDKVVHGDPRRVFAAMADHLRKFLNAAVASRPDETVRLEEARGRLGEIEQELDRLRKTSRDLRIREIELSGGLPSEAIGNQCRELQTQKLMLDVELAGLRARREAVLQRLAISEKRVAERREEPDFDLKRLEATVRLHQNNYKRLLEANRRIPGSISQGEVEQARLELERAQLEIESHRQARKRQPQDELLAALNGQLAQIDIDAATVEAKLRAIEKLLSRLEPENLRRQAALQALAADVEATNSRLEQVVDQRAAARRELARLEERTGAMQPPKVTLLDELTPGLTAPAEDKPMETPARK